MIKKYITTVGMLSGLLLYAQSGFPYYTSLKNTQPAEFVKPTTTPANVAAFNANGLLLVPNTTQQFGTVYLEKVFSTTNGIQIEFDFSMYNGSNLNGADGFSFYMFDGGVITPSFGTIGSGLGYTYNYNRDVPDADAVGVTDAYIGIGFDGYGNFKQRRYQDGPSEGKDGIGPETTGLSDPYYTLSDNSRSHITLRGAAGKSTNASPVPGKGSFTDTNLRDNYKYGYPVLATRSTYNNSSTNSYITLNQATGAFTKPTNTGTAFNLNTMTATESTTNADYRKAYIKIMPDGAGGSWVTVTVYRGSTTGIQQRTMYQNFRYNKTVKYDQNDYYNENSGSQIVTLNTTIPNTFKMGFSGSTGNETNNILIRNLKVVIPYSAEPQDDNLSICGTNASLSVLSNDVAYSGIFNPATPTEPTANNANIDKNTFQFIDTNGNLAGTSITTTKGTYTYDAVTGIVNFEAVAGATGTESVTYSIKGIAPYNSEDRRGRANINITIGTPPTISGNSNVIVGGTLSLTGTPTPATTTPWVSSNTAVATVNNSGLVTGISLGTATITYTNNIGCSITKMITVGPPSCYKNAVLSGTALTPFAGISTIIGRNTNLTWKDTYKGADMVVESKTGGFVLNRLTQVQIAAIPAANLVEGMIVYNITTNKMNIYVVNGADTGWKTFETQSCL